MSSAIVDTGAPPEALFLYSSHKLEASNSASTVLRSSMDPNFGFSSSSMEPSKPAEGLSRPPRLAKLRKQLHGNRTGFVPPMSQTGVIGGTQEPRIDSGFSRPRAVFPGVQNADRGFVFLGDSAGNNDVEMSKATEKLLGLNIGSGRADSFGMNTKTNLAGDGASASGSNYENRMSGKDQDLQRDGGSEVSELGEDIQMLHLNNENRGSENVDGVQSQMKKLNVNGVEQHITDNFGRNDGVMGTESLNAAFPAMEGGFKKDEFLNRSTNEKVDSVYSRAEDKFIPKGIRKDGNPVKVDGVAETVYSFNDIESEEHFDSRTMHKNPDKISGYGSTYSIPGSSNSGFTFLFGSEGKASSASLRFKNGNVSSSSSIFGSSWLHFNPLGAVPEMAATSTVDKNPVFMFSSKLDNVAAANMEFKTPDTKAPLLFGLNRKLETKREAASGLKKKKSKSYKPMSTPMMVPMNFVPQESVQENSESSDQYSPMDFSPYEETLVNNNTLSRGSSLGSEESYHLEDNSSSTEMHVNVPNQVSDEDLISATEALHPSEGEINQQEHEESACMVESSRVGMSEEDSASVVDTESFKSATDELEYSSETFVSALETEASSSFGTEPQNGDVEAESQRDASFKNEAPHSFTFAASDFMDEPSGSSRMQRKNSRNKLFGNPYNPKSIPTAPAPFSQFPSFQVSGSTALFSDFGKKPDSDFENQSRRKIEQPKELMLKKDSSTASGIATLESCEKWRMRGNQAYAKGDFLKAEDFYSQGIDSISKNETSRSCLRALMLCYSNRAATRMSLGRLREALEDCDSAYALDPNFLKVQVRAAGCYLALGEVENATLKFKKCLKEGPEISADRNLLIEASEGLEKAKKVEHCMKLASEFLGRKTSDSLDSAIKTISEGLSISSYSEKLLQMKAEILFMLKKYEESIQLCEQILGYAESNFSVSGVGSLSMDFNGPEQKKAPSFRVFCCFLIIKSYFYMGKLEQALLFVKNKEESDLNLKSESGNLEAILPLIDIMRKLIHHKGAGNEAYKARKNAEAVEHYTAAISCSVESRPFAAICFCNRAAAYRALGQTLDAISDCSIAIALDGSYYKAISRRAALYELIRDYGQAAADFRKLVSLYKKQGDQKINSGGPTDALDYKNELLQAQHKLLKMEEASSNEVPLNLYLILGVDQSVDAPEIKKAYRKAALKYHPDKAGQSFVRSENSDDATWKEIAEEVRKDAEKLFKMIGEAYAVLSDTDKRALYNLEEEMRTATNQRGNTYSTRDFSDLHNYKFERTTSSSRRYWQDSWRSHGGGASFRGSERSNYNWY